MSCELGSCRVRCGKADRLTNKCGDDYQCVDGFCMMHPVVNDTICRERDLVFIPMEEICQSECLYGKFAQIQSWINSAETPVASDWAYNIFAVFGRKRDRHTSF